MDGFRLPPPEARLRLQIFLPLETLQPRTPSALHEQWSGAVRSTRSHFAAGIYQYFPENKFSVPEEYVPLVGGH